MFLIFRCYDCRIEFYLIAEAGESEDDYARRLVETTELACPDCGELKQRCKFSEGKAGA
jgi:DNA-directed RNA polymerase subunit RPC12/RpoP